MTNDKIFYSNDAENQEKPVIIISDKPEPSDSLPEGETPTIIIERENDKEILQTVQKPRKRWAWFVVGALVAALICAAALGAYKYYRTYINIGIPVSCTCEQNIEKLQQPIDTRIKPEVVMTSDSVLGVKLNFYELRGLKAEVSFIEPSPDDKSVYLYSRCADFDKNNEVMGSLVEQGKAIKNDVTRLGYCAMANDNVVIGVARSEDVKDYVIKQGGSFFRQFILVSNFNLPTKFHLHGKVERRAIGRLVGDHAGLYYIESVYPETMYDFADALREYGFIDAIYITGGKAFSYYRTLDGKSHQIGYDRVFKRSKYRTQVPYVVFKKR